MGMKRDLKTFLFFYFFFNFYTVCLSSPPLGKMFSKVKVCNQIQFFTPEYSALVTAQKVKFSMKDFFSKCDQIRRFHFLRTYDELDNIHLNYQLQVFTILNTKRIANHFIAYGFCSQVK